jgi:ElaB/YqjD/DUF883 family membrane-anchored ribosome-binding protein
MFQRRSTEFDPRLSSIAGHLSAIEKELSGIGKSAGQRASTGAAAAGNQIADVIWPILNDIADHFGRGQRMAVDQATTFGNHAAKTGVRIGGGALDRIAIETRNRPLATLAVAIGVGVLIGMAARRN